MPTTAPWSRTTMRCAFRIVLIRWATMITALWAVMVDNAARSLASVS